MQPATQVKANYSFTVVQEGDNYKISYERAKYSPAIIVALLFPAFALSFVMIFIINPHVSTLVFMFCLFAVGPYFLLNFLRKGGSFLISPTALIIDTRAYDKSHISKFFIKAPGGYEETIQYRSKSIHGFAIGGDQVTRVGMGATVAFASGVGAIGNAGHVAMQESRNKIRKEYEKVNFSISFIHGEKEVKLAGGLTENTAQVMLNKVLELSTPG